VSKLATELRATDLILQAWSASVGDGLHDAPWADVPVSRIPPLDDQLAIVVDQLVCRAHPDTRRLMGFWYRTTLPRSEIARKMNCHRDTLYVRWNAGLAYFRARFLESPLTRLREAAAAELPDQATVRVEPRVRIEVETGMTWQLARVV